MAFTVHRPEGSKDEFNDKSTYEFENGLLKVIVIGEAGDTTLLRTFSPSGWSEVTADPEHKPGSPKGGKPLGVPKRIR